MFQMPKTKPFDAMCKSFALATAMVDLWSLRQFSRQTGDKNVQKN